MSAKAFDYQCHYLFSAKGMGIDLLKEMGKKELEHQVFEAKELIFFLALILNYVLILDAK